MRRLVAAARRAGAVVVALGVTPIAAYAHSGAAIEPHDIWSAWTLDPVVIALLAVTGIAYAVGVTRLWRTARTGAGISRRQCIAFFGGWLVLVTALVSPLHALGGVLFSAHMTQHELLLGLATPLLVIGRPIIAFVWAINPDSRRATASVFRTNAVSKAWSAVSSPLAGFLIHSAALGIWHLPSLYQATLTSEWIHAAQHTTFIFTGSLFWWTMLHTRGERAGRGRGAAIGYLFATVLITGALGAILTFSTTLWYPVYAATTSSWGFTPLEDQQLGGIIMWVPGGLPYLIAALFLLSEWLRESGRNAFEPRISTIARIGAVVLLFVAAGCDRASGDNALAVNGGDAKRGEREIRKYGCGSCHAFPGITGSRAIVGPPLTGIAQRSFIAGVLPNTPDNLVTWIENPPAVDPKTAMPNMGVSGRDARDIAAYLYTLK
jgi:putative membrane protein